MRYSRPVFIDIPEDCRVGRKFRDVLEAVQNGLEQLGEQCSKSEFDFKKPDDVDMNLPTTIFVEKMDIGCEMSGMGDFEDRLADRLGLKTAPDGEAGTTE